MLFRFHNVLWLDLEYTDQHPLVECSILGVLNKGEQSITER